MDFSIPFHCSHKSPPVNDSGIDGGTLHKSSFHHTIFSPSGSLSESEQNLKTEEEEEEAAEEDDEDEEDEEEDEDLEEERPSIPVEEQRSHPPCKKLKLPGTREEPEHHSNGIVAEDDANTVVDYSSTKPLSVSSKKKPKSKKKTSSNVWISRSSRKGKKKAKPPPQSTQQPEDNVLITPVPRFFDKSDDTPEITICLSKVYKAEKVDLSEDRLSAASSKGYRMVRATRGVCDGAWYFEIKIVKLGETGHTRLGWSTEKGDLQAPVGYDSNSFAYRDADGSKVHKALREKYGEEGYSEGDVIGFYINLPEGASFAPKPPQLVWYKGQRYLCALDPKEGPPKIVPGSEISFFKNGICQGVAFKDLYGGRYFPAASLYTLPNEPNCEVKFNFGPEFDAFPLDFGGRVIPKAMIEVPYYGYDVRSDYVEAEEKQS